MRNHDLTARILALAAAAVALTATAVPALAAPAPAGGARAGSWAVQHAASPRVPEGQLAGVSCPAAGACVAVGSANDASGIAVTLAEAWNGTAWSLQRTANPAGPGNSVLSAVACTSATACIAVGSQANAAGVTAPLAEAWNGTSWSIQPVPSPAGAAGGALFGISCPAAAACVAVGNYVDAAGAHVALAENWNGTSWSAGPAKNPARASRSFLNGVSCTSATGCEAVGDYRNGSGKSVTLAEAWNGSAWSVQATPNPPSPSKPTLAGVSCTSPGACIAVGSYHGGGGNHTLAESWDGTAWSLQTTLTPAPTSVLSSVSCLSASDCIAVGNSEPTDILTGAGTLAEAWNGTAWSLESTPNPQNLTTSGLAGVSCTSPGACTAVGSYHNPSDINVTLAQAWDGTAWSIRATPTPPGPDTSALLAVSCPAADACEAVGFRDNGKGVQVPLAQAWNGTRWALQAMPSPAGFLVNLTGLSCASARACVAVGEYTESGGNVVPLAEAWNGTAWSITPVAEPADRLYSVSCTSATVCTAVGRTARNGVFVTLAERWNGSSWSIQPTPNPAKSTGAELRGVSCTSATACAAVGDYSAGAVAERWNGSSWSLQPGPSPLPNGVLFSVSCASPSACTAVGTVSDAAGPLAERWNGSSWSVQPLAKPAGATFLSLVGVSCTSPSACTTVGLFAGPGELRDFPLAEAWNGTSWSAQKTASPVASSDLSLAGVGCAATGPCEAVGDYLSADGIELPLAEARS